MSAEPVQPHSPQKTKLFRQEKFIRFFGLVMMCSPFVNFALSIAPVQNVGDKTSLPVLWHLAKNISVIHWGLWAASFVVGLMMLKGRRSSWISVLAILGIFIVFDFLNFKRNLVRGWEQPLASIAFNIFIFVLVYVQEFRQSSQPRPKPVKAQAPVKVAAPPPPKVVSPPPQAREPNPVVTWMKNVKMPTLTLPKLTLPKPVPKPAIVATEPKAVQVAPPPPPKPIQPQVVPSRLAEKQNVPPVQESENWPKLPNLVGYIIDFDGMGPWARIVNLDQRELYLRGFREPHPMLTTRAVEMDLNGETYRLRMTSRQGQLYTFRFETVVKAKPKLRLVS